MTGRDRPRPGPLRTLHRRVAVAHVQHHDGLDLFQRDRQGTSRRLLGQNGPGDSPHHRRDQGAFAASALSAPTLSSSRSAARWVTSNRALHRVHSPVPRDVGRDNGVTCTSPGAYLAPSGSRRPSRPSTRSPSYVRAAFSPTSSSVEATSRSPMASSARSHCSVTCRPTPSSRRSTSRASTICSRTESRGSTRCLQHLGESTSRAPID